MCCRHKTLGSYIVGVVVNKKNSYVVNNPKTVFIDKKFFKVLQENMTSVTDLQTMFVDLLWCQDFFLELDRIMKSAEIFAIIIYKVKRYPYYA